MMRSLFSGVAGIKVHQTRMDVIGNNIANINTIGFKGSRTTFSDMLSQMQSAASSATDTRGGINPRQIGLGVNVESIDLIFTDSSPQSTGKNTDLALSGNGLFYLKDGNQSYYTRNGSFLFDEQGYYVMAGTGLRVQGWNATDGVINTNGATTDVIVPVGKTMEATATTQITYNGNLDKESRIIKSISYTAASSEDADESLVVTKETPYSTSITINLPDGFVQDPTSDTPVYTVTGTLTGTTQYAANADVSSELTATYVRGEAGTGDNAGLYRYNIVYTDSKGNEVARGYSADYLGAAPTEAATITAVASAASTEGDSINTSVNVDGTNVVAATITFKDGTTQNVTSGYYEVGKTVPITTLATVYDSLGGKHEVTLLIDKDPDSAGGDATPTDSDALASGKIKYTYADDTGATKTVSLSTNNSAISTTTEDDVTTTTYSKTYNVTRRAAVTDGDNADPAAYIYNDGEGDYVYTNVETGHVLTTEEAATVTGDETNGFTYTPALTVLHATDPIYDNRWRLYIAPGIGEKGPAVNYDSDNTTVFANSYTRSEENGNAELDGSSTTGSMNFIPYLYFNDRGAFINNGRSEDSAIVFEYGDGNGAGSNQAVLSFASLTQYANSTTSFPTSNGNTAGVLQSVAVDSAGIISGTYTNGLIRQEAQVSVAQFSNSSGLTKAGATIYQESNNSGTANIRTVADFGLNVTSSALEMSNVDLATEFSEMIITQRGFQANSKVTTVSDEMLETLVNMKR